MASSPQNQVYCVEHLATFSTSSPHQQQTTPKMALQRLFAMEKTSGIWTQRMALQIEGSYMKIIDGDTNEPVEKFPVTLIQQPTAFNHSNHIYDNILILTVQHPEESQGELHIFQCSSHSAQQIVEDLNHWMRRHGNNLITASDHVSANNQINVKEAVQNFNAIAAQREIKSVSPVIGSAPGRVALGQNGGRDQDSITTTSSMDSSHHNGAHRTNSHDQSLSNERYVSILNHCFDDIERFIIRLQHAAAALRELQLRNHKRQGKGPSHGGDGLLTIRARGPSEEEFFEILSKFKLAFNLLAKLKGCIHDPNAPELVHFLFTPLAIIIEAARSNGPSAIDPSMVGVPYLNTEAIELLSNCCTSKEYDLWQSLGPNWQHVVQPSRILPASYQPVFTDGWAPTITEPELMGFTSSSDRDSSEQEDDSIPIPVHVHREGTPIRRSQHYDDSDADDSVHHQMDQMDHQRDHQRMSPSHRGPPPPTGHHGRIVQAPSPSLDSIERDSPTAVQVNDLEQSEWLADLHARNAKIVRVLFPRTANNDKELTVVRGEILEVLDDSRKWWKARNWRGQMAHVPHTIVTEISNSTNGRDSHQSRGSPNEDWIRKERQAAAAAAAAATTAAAAGPLFKSEMLSRFETRNKVSPQSDHHPNGWESGQDVSSRQRRESQGFQEELMATLRTRKNEPKSSASGEGQRSSATVPLSMSSIGSKLLAKGFAPETVRRVLALIEKGPRSCGSSQWLLSLSRNQLREDLQHTLIDEVELQRLYSNLLIFKNIHSPDGQEYELTSKLAKRRSQLESEKATESLLNLNEAKKSNQILYL